MNSLSPHALVMLKRVSQLPPRAFPVIRRYAYKHLWMFGKISVTFAGIS